MTIDSVEGLREIYRPASGGAVDKVIGVLDEHCRDFLAKSPFFVLSSADGEGRCDGSPKGGHPGFVEMLDEHRVAWADYSGNNRLDSFENVIDNANVALLFLIPGLSETLRINGTAELSTGTELRERFAVDGRSAKVVAIVNVAEAYVHCAKALRRSELWEPDSWIDADARPNASEMIKDHAAIDVPAEVIEQALANDLEATLWKPGGHDVAST
ncbi:MAG: MSMEG_1061 family FMN-dependent PPOX-type flavoprotein [Ilumatobacter sp.]|uniref:MSMEG_1061 family FMN-dependent PPOX-type flavoprotein n=1 Tax=Ilumatobacter sp. TaxID=1967498 RepID=UPI003C788AD9